MEEQVWKMIAGMQTPGFFVTAEVQRKGSVMPEGLETFIHSKLALIHKGLATRRFVFQGSAYLSISLSLKTLAIMLAAAMLWLFSSPISMFMRT